MSDYETAQRRRNLIVGTFVFIAICALTWMVLKFGDFPLMVSKWKSYQVTVQFPSARGVEENTPVYFCGYQIGKVIYVHPPQQLEDLETGLVYHQTAVVLAIENKFSDIPDNVEAKLMTRGLGSSYIEFKVPLIGPNEPTRGVLTDKTTLQGSAGMTSEFFPEESQKKLQELVDGLSALVGNANEIVGDNANKENIKDILENLAKATQQATETVKEIRRFAAAGANTLDNANTHMDKLVVAFVDAGEQMSKVAAEMRILLKKINSGQGSAARFVNDGRLYENMLESSQQMELLLQEMKSFVAESRDEGLKIKLK